MNPSPQSGFRKVILIKKLLNESEFREADLEKLFAKQITLRKGAPAIVWKNH